MLKHLGFIISEAKRCGDIVKGLLDFSRKDQNDFEPRHLHEILQETFELMTHSMKVANVNFLSDFSAKSDLIFCSPNQIKQVCVAILVNAMEAVRKTEKYFSGQSIRMKNIYGSRLVIMESVFRKRYSAYF